MWGRLREGLGGEKGGRGNCDHTRKKLINRLINKNASPEKKSLTELGRWLLLLCKHEVLDSNLRCHYKLLCMPVTLTLRMKRQADPEDSRAISLTK